MDTEAGGGGKEVCFEDQPNPEENSPKVGPPKGFRQPKVADATILGRVTPKNGAYQERQ